MTRELDCRGLACPQPVLNTKDVLDQTPSGMVMVTVDNPAARDNVTRFAKSQGCAVEIQGQGPEFTLLITKGQPAAEAAPSRSGAPAGTPRLIVRLSSNLMGTGSEELGRILMKAFIKSLSDATVKPAALVFYNSGVHLTCTGSEHLDALRQLEQSGVQLFSCGTCLDFFGLKDKLAVGVVTNMYEIIETLSSADRVVSP
jgi:selenium metabolism protein YedF